MKRKLIFLLSLAAAASCNAAVTFTFATDLQGFVAANFGTGSADTTVTYSTVNGGSMALTNNRTAANANGGRFGDIVKYL